MTKLLVSVRDAWEAGEALAGGAQVIDVKEPRLGSLGAASPETRNAVRLVLQSAESVPCGVHPQSRHSVALSAALGELLEHHRPMASSQLDGYLYAKVGLAGCGAVEDWERRWRNWIADLPPTTSPVAVIYADYRSVNAPDPWRVLEAANGTPVRTLLVDTCDKTAGDIWTRITACELEDVISTAQSAGYQVALAGSITFESLDEAVRFRPDWIAVRGAVCRRGRESILDRERVKRFVDRLSTPSAADAADRCDQTIDSATNRA